MRRSATLTLVPAVAMLGGLGAVSSASAAPSSRPGPQRVLAGLQIRPQGFPNLCLEVADANTGNGALVTLWPCTGNSNQRWSFGGGRFLSDLPGNKCLDIRGGNTGDGAAINTYDCHPGNPQQWRESGNRIINALNGKCLSVLANNFAGGAAVVTYGCNNGDGQKWERS
ncbi:RICIN domain-containing protein [Actinomadura roseirufa]|uniref:RICIN domain-containing protein n=1 Tax=Actinomadura roseirufa TaxID=2094049 RepID=UPI0013F15EF3|nr:RICIN domain-containing protein [Actinomadura roseirufa]